MNRHYSEPEIDLVIYEQNRRQLPFTELQKFAGRWVAIRADGTQVVASGCSIEDLGQELSNQGIDGSAVVWERIPAPDEETLL